jgi:hypothetical protein
VRWVYLDIGNSAGSPRRWTSRSATRSVRRATARSALRARRPDLLADVMYGSSALPVSLAIGDKVLIGHRRLYGDLRLQWPSTASRR